MKATVLLNALLAQPDLPHEKIQAVFDALPEKTNLTDFRNALIDGNVMSYREVMNVFVKQALVPKSKTLLTRIEQKRKDTIYFKPEEHKHKYHIQEEDQMNRQLMLSSGEFPITIPEPKIKRLSFVHSDEKQAVMLAMEMINMEEFGEVEIILLETLETFANSKAAAEFLSWLYLCTGHIEECESCAKTAIDNGLENQEIIELLALAEQGQNKHLLATAHYQKLLQLNRVKSLWYLLIAYSQERSNCIREAAENYQIYATIGKDDNLKRVAEQHLRALRA